MPLMLATDLAGTFAVKLKEEIVMKEFWNTIQLVITAIGGWLGYFLGGCDGLLFALMAFVVID